MGKIMLKYLEIRNFVLIDKLKINFNNGFNVLTGETGAGKSIIISALELITGEKGSIRMVGSNGDRLIVMGCFSLQSSSNIVKSKLKEWNIEINNNELNIKREITKDGKSKSFINNVGVRIAELKELGDLIVDIHGQHDNQTLLHRKNHLTLLDLYGKEQTDPLKEKMASCYQEWKAVCKKVEQSSLDEESRRRELSLAEFEVNEIEEAALKEGEDELLEEQYRKMTDSRKLTEGVAEAYQYTAEDERGNASDYLSRAIRSLQEAASFDEKGSQLYDQIVEIDSLLNDFNRDLAEYAKSFEYSEEESSSILSAVILLMSFLSEAKI